MMDYEQKLNSYNLRDFTNKAIYDEFIRRSKCAEYPEKRIVLFGPPGSGKGTQGTKLTYELCSCHISTGDLLREQIRYGTTLGMKAKSIMDRGDLVPDELVLDIINQKINSEECKKGVVFDGFPRTVQQAEKLEELLAKRNEKIDKVFNFDIQQEILIDRLSGRRVHESSGRTYHIKYNPPKNADKDDLTGEPLIQRIDDKPEVIAKRMANYRNITEPILSFYQGRGNLYNLDAREPIDRVWKEIAGRIFL